MQLVKSEKTERPPPPPVVGIRLKKTTAEVVRGSAPAQGGGVRGEITEISKRSIKNAKEVLTNADPELQSMIVCTYPDTYPHDGRVVKAHHKALKQAVERRFGDFDYFTAFEFQSRGAPHFHIGVSIDLAQFGEVETLKRGDFIRRKPTFQTVVNIQDWAFYTWMDIIREPDPSYNGQKLEWSGLGDHDIQMMKKAYNDYNSGFSWEVMREIDGAKKYFVKELTGLKGYQKTIPDDYNNPGRPFLYSKGMKFDEQNAIEFAVTDSEIRTFLEEAGWEYLPDENKPLYKHLWNAAELLAERMINAGLRPIKGSLDKLRKFSDLRMFEFANKAGDLWRKAAQMADLEQAWSGYANWERIKRKIEYEKYWEWTFANGPA